MLKDRLRAARKKAGLSLRDLAAKVDRKVTAQAIGKYERGEMQPSPKVLEMLALALGVQKEALTSSQLIELGTIEFRENRLIRSKKDENIVNATIDYNLRRYLKIEEILDVTPHWDKPRGFPFPVRDTHEAEWAAHRLRDDWNLGNDAIPNLSEFLEERGFKVILLNLPSSIAGITCFVANNVSDRAPVIGTSKEITGERQRFTLAHELGHLLLEFSNPSLDVELLCNKFAGAFLMPERVLWEVLGKSRKKVSIGELVALKKFLGVSVQALTYRAKDLGIISNYTYKLLYSEFARRGWLKPPFAEPSPVEVEEPQRFKRLCLRALAEEVITDEVASELLNMPIDAMMKEFNADQND